MVRPLVLLFQEFAERTATPITPDLNTVLIGPAYQIYDYPDDRALLEIAPYGQINGGNYTSPPLPNVPAITLGAPPGAAPGSWVVPSSVRVFFEDARVVLTAAGDGSTTTIAPYENALYSPNARFLDKGVQAGDTILLQPPDNDMGPPTLATVMEVENNTLIRISSNFQDEHTNVVFRIERRLGSQEISSQYFITPDYQVSNEIKILGGVQLLVGKALCRVSYARVFVAYRAFRTDLQQLDSVSTTSEILTKIGRIDSRNTLAACLHTARQNAGQAPIYFYGIGSDDTIGYSRARDALSIDETLYAMVPLTSDLSIIASFKTENEQLSDPNLAINQGIPQKFRVVIGSGTLPSQTTILDEDNEGYPEQLENPMGISSDGGSAQTAPGLRRIRILELDALTNKLRPGDKLILSASANPVPLDGTYTIAHINEEEEVELEESLPVAVDNEPEGISFRVMRPSTGVDVIPFRDERRWTAPRGVKIMARIAGSAGRSRRLGFLQNFQTAGGIHRIDEIPGEETIVYADFESNGVSAQDMINALIGGAGVTEPFAGSVNFTAEVAESQEGMDMASLSQRAFDVETLESLGGGGGRDLLETVGTLDNVYVNFLDPDGTFLTAGVLPGDLLELPDTLTRPFGTKVKRFTVDRVMSEQRLQIQNMENGAYRSNGAAFEYELPHTDNRLGRGQLLEDLPLPYRIVRVLNKDQQVAQLVSVSQSFNSRRAILTWPDQVTVAGLVDGSKPKNADGTLALAGPQPGYYLSAVVGGMTAGLPSQQGFSRLGIAGISRLAHANDHFSEKQLTDLSDGGWYVFAQNSPASLPYSIHQLTTDPSALESGEFSIVKNYDFVSLFFLGILEPFLGVWNVNNDTLGFVRQAMNTGIEQLKLRRVAKIGAPLNDASLTGVEISKAAADRIEVYMEVDLPKPLNVLGLHLVA